MHAVEAVSSNYMLQTVFTTVKIVFVGYSAMTPCGLAGGYQRSCRTCCLRLYFCLADGGSVFLRNVRCLYIVTQNLVTRAKQFELKSWPCISERLIATWLVSVSCRRPRGSVWLCTNIFRASFVSHMPAVS